MKRFGIIPQPILQTPGSEYKFIRESRHFNLFQPDRAKHSVSARDWQHDTLSMCTFSHCRRELLCNTSLDRWISISFVIFTRLCRYPYLIYWFGGVLPIDTFNISIRSIWVASLHLTGHDDRSRSPQSSIGRHCCNLMRLFLGRICCRESTPR